MSDDQGQQYDNPNQEVVGTDIVSDAGNEVQSEPWPRQQEADDEEGASD